MKPLLDLPGRDSSEPATSARTADGDPVDEHSDAGGGSPAVLGRRLFTEAFGTLLLVSVDCGGAMIGALEPDVVTPAARAAAMGLLVMAMIYAVGNTSGAHFNPAVTLAFTLRKAFPLSRLPLYWLAQLTGAVLAALALRGLLGDVAHTGTATPGHGVWRGFVVEVFLTMVLVTIVLGTATRHRSVGPNAAIASGAAVALCGLFSRPMSGASMNPARSLAPALVSGELREIWIYLTAPFLGAALACLATSVVHTRKHDSEKDAAQGR